MSVQEVAVAGQLSSAGLKRGHRTLFVCPKQRPCWQEGQHGLVR